MQGRTFLSAIAGAAWLAVAACGVDDDPGTEPRRTGQTGGEYSAFVTEPTYLAPASNCYESECFTILEMVNDRLVSVDSTSGELNFDGLAESIWTNEDNTVWTVTLKEGRTFHNGEPVDAEAFSRAWNYSQDPRNAQATAGFMARIEGAGEGQEMSGFDVINERTFEVTLDIPFSQFGHQMSYAPAFAPIARECLADLKACNEEPIGTGPYMMDGPWQHNESITVTRWPDYAGEQPAQADTVKFQMFSDPMAAFRDFQNGGLDVLTLTPDTYLEAKRQFGDAILEESTSDLFYLGLPTQLAPFDNKLVRQAISMAIDRQLVVDQVVHGLGDPSTDIVTPPIPGARDDACTYCTFDPERARRLLDDSGVDPNGQTLQFYYSSGEGVDQQVDAVARQVQQNLSFDYELQSTSFARFLELLESESFQGPYFVGWFADYPSPENFLRPIVGTRGDVNYLGYSNKELDDLLIQGDEAADLADGIEFYQRAGDVALEDMPVIPLYSGKTAVVFSEDVSDVRWNQDVSVVAFEEITVE